jgi:hypothetical protein
MPQVNGSRWSSRLPMVPGSVSRCRRAMARGSRMRCLPGRSGSRKVFRASPAGGTSPRRALMSGSNPGSSGTTSCSWISIPACGRSRRSRSGSAGGTKTIMSGGMRRTSSPAGMTGGPWSSMSVPMTGSRNGMSRSSRSPRRLVRPQAGLPQFRGTWIRVMVANVRWLSRYRHRRCRRSPRSCWRLSTAAGSWPRELSWPGTGCGCCRSCST